MEITHEKDSDSTMVATSIVAMTSHMETENLEANHHGSAELHGRASSPRRSTRQPNFVAQRRGAQDFNRPEEIITSNTLTSTRDRDPRVHQDPRPTVIVHAPGPSNILDRAQATSVGLDNPPGNVFQGPVQPAHDVGGHGQQDHLGQKGTNPTGSAELVHENMDMDC